MALHRYFVWADRMRTHLDEVVSHAGATESFFVHPYLSYWFGGLYVVIEGWTRLGLQDAKINALLASPNVRRLNFTATARFTTITTTLTTNCSVC